MAAIKALKHLTRLQDTRVLVFGGTSGIGFSVAEAALESGASIILSGSNQDRLDKAISRLQDHHRLLAKTTTIPNGGGNNGIPVSITSQEKPEDIITGHTCDLSDATTLDTNLEILLKFATKDGTYKLDHVVYTAGDTIAIKPITEATVDSIQKSTMVRLMAPAIVAKHMMASGYMKSSARSSITLTSGTNSNRPSPGWSVAAAVGSGVEGLGRGLAVDFKPIRVNVVSPGAVKTELWDGIPEDKVGDVVEKFKKQSLTDTVGTPDECAEAYMYCMRSSFTTGTVVVCDGGRLVA